jgi:hypothetical protein
MRIVNETTARAISGAIQHKNVRGLRVMCTYPANHAGKTFGLTERNGTYTLITF